MLSYHFYSFICYSLTIKCTDGSTVWSDGPWNKYDPGLNTMGFTLFFITSFHKTLDVASSWSTLLKYPVLDEDFSQSIRDYSRVVSELYFTSPVEMNPVSVKRYEEPWSSGLYTELHVT